MKSEAKGFNKIYNGLVSVIFSVIVSGYWILAHSINVYEYALAGAIFEILWVFMIPLVFAIPVLSLIAAINNKFKRSFLYIISILLNLGTFFWIIFG
jgi:hypothetical protein